MLNTPSIIQSYFRKSFTIHLTTDYPGEEKDDDDLVCLHCYVVDGTVLCCGSADVEVLNKPLPSIFCSIFTGEH